MAADLILIVGCTGAGKTTYARRLADEIGGIRFSIDEWMMALFWKPLNKHQGFGRSRRFPASRHHEAPGR